MLTPEQKKMMMNSANLSANKKKTGESTSYTTDTEKFDREAVKARLSAIPGYEAPKPMMSISNPKKEDSRGFLENIGEGLKGATKGLGSTIIGTGELGNKALGKIFGNDTSKDTSFAEGVKSKYLTPTNKAQKVGFIGEQIAEFFIPGGAISKGVKATEIATKGSKVATMGARMLGEALTGAGQTAMQKGGIDKEVGQAGLYGAILPPAFSAAGKIVKTTGKVGASVLGKMTGTQGAIEEAFSHPNVMKYAREAGKDQAGFMSEVLGTVKQGVSKIAQDRSSQYKALLAKIKLDKNSLDDITRSVRNTAVGVLDEFDIKIVPQEYGGKKLNGLDFSKSSIVEGQPLVERALNDVMGWTDNTATGLDKLKQRLAHYSDQLSSGEKRKAKAIVDSLAGTVRQSLEKNVKGYREMTSGYREASGLINEINKTFSLGDKKTQETMMKKLMGSLRTNNEMRKELLKKLPGGENIIPKIAGAQLAETTPRGLQGVLAPGAIGISAMMQPTFIPQIMAVAALSSPRVAGELTNILGKVDRQMIKVNKFSPEIQRAIRELFIKNNQ